jgi:hypothetical protein
MTDNDYMEVLYNECYGGWKLSDKILKEYENRMKEKNPEYVLIKHHIKRHDHILVELYHEMTSEFQGASKNSYIKSDEIEKKYKDYYRIKEYDGLESVKIRYYKYNYDTLHNKLKDILTSEKTNEEKIKDIKEI